MQYTAFRDGKSVGTFTEEQLKAALASGVLRPSDTYFGEGMSGIMPLGQLGRSARVEALDVPRSSSPSSPAPSAPSLAKDEPTGSPDWDTLPSGPVPICCARCQSAEIKSVPLVCKMGQSSGSMAGMTLSGDVGFGTTHSRSDLAEELAPPVKATGALAIFLCGVGLAAFFGISNMSISTFYVITGLGLVAAIAYSISVSRAYARSMYLWRNRWICLKCGHKFLSVAPSALASLKDEQ
jgi:hypothetical protein